MKKLSMVTATAIFFLGSAGAALADWVQRDSSTGHRGDRYDNLADCLQNGGTCQWQGMMISTSDASRTQRSTGAFYYQTGTPRPTQGLSQYCLGENSMVRKPPCRSGETVIYALSTAGGRVIRGPVRPGPVNPVPEQPNDL